MIADKNSDLERSVHLSASAGSGKTSALKDRYLALLDELDLRRLAIDQVVAITFTDKAAAEIKDRVMQSLHGPREPLLKKIIRGRQDLRISTIHSFCMNLLKRYPLEAGLPPDFGVLDERDRAALLRQSVEAALEELDRDPVVMEPLREASAGALLDAVLFLLSIRSRIRRMEIDAGGPDGLVRSVRSGTGAGATTAALAALLAGKEWREAFERVAAQIARLGVDPVEARVEAHLQLARAQDADGARRISRRLEDLFLTKAGTPRAHAAIPKGGLSPKVHDPYREAYRTAQELFIRFLDLHARAASGRSALSLLRLFQRAEEIYGDAKLREGALDFDDLEIHAYRLLMSQESPEVLYWLDRKVLHYLVDEFQDTSDIQWAILKRLTEEIFAGQGAVKGMAPTLFVVGDKKQSIYRFREANYRLIDGIRTRMERLPAELRDIRTLDRNYRSAPEVVGAANQVFAALWQGDYQPSAADRSGHRGSVRLIEVLPGGPPEAEALAAEIERIIRAKTTIHERNGSEWKERPATFGDCAVLVQSRTRLKEYEAALRARMVPFRVIGGIGFFEEDEVQAVINLLFALWNPDDRLALAAALRSPLFGLTDADLARLAQDGRGFLEGLRTFRPDIAEMLSRWRDLSGVAPLSRLLHRVINDTAAYLRFGRPSPQAVFNLDKLLDTAREFDRRGHTTLQDFVEWVKNIQATEQREASADMNLPGDKGAVSIMTVHKAKGLEFPLLFLPGLNQQPLFLKKGPPVIVEESGDGLRMAWKDAGGPAYAELWEREQAELLREHQRLLYVAITRARDHLTMIGALSDRKTPVLPSTWLRYLHDAIPSLGSAPEAPEERVRCFAWPDWRAQPLAMPPAFSETTEQDAGPPAAVDTGAVLAGIAPLPSSAVEKWSKATDLLDSKRELQIEQPAPREGRLISPLTRGNLFHRCLEEYAKTGSLDPDGAAKGFPEIQALGAEERKRLLDEADRALSAVIGNSDFGWIFKQQTSACSELPFLYRTGGGIISGVIDRLIVNDGAGFVIDYKAIAVESEEALQGWIDHYRPQLRVYCEAAKEIFGLSTAEGYLLFLDSGRLALTVKV